jgi:hypothetical protein
MLLNLFSIPKFDLVDLLLSHLSHLTKSCFSNLQVSNIYDQDTTLTTQVCSRLLAQVCVLALMVCSLAGEEFGGSFVEISPLTRGKSVSAIFCVESSRVVEFLDIVLITISSTCGAFFAFQCEEHLRHKQGGVSY